MPPTKKHEVPGIGMVEFEQVPFEVKREEWNEYLIPGRGLKVRFRTTATRMWIAKDGRRAPNGEVLMMVDSQQIAQADDLIPEGLE